MKEHTTTGEICLDGSCGLVYSVGTISYTVREDESYVYIFVPNWNVIDLLEAPAFQGVPGFDLDVRKESYIREDFTPTFVSERTPSENREDLWQILDVCGMEYYDRLEWLIRTDTRYIGDNLYVRSTTRTKKYSAVEVEETIASAVNSEHAVRKLIEALAEGVDLVVGGTVLSMTERKMLHRVFLPLLEKTTRYRESQKRAGIKAAASRGAYGGRKRMPVDQLVLREVIELYGRHEVTAKEAAQRLRISEATFYRRLKEFRSDQDA